MFQTQTVSKTQPQKFHPFLRQTQLRFMIIKQQYSYAITWNMMLKWIKQYMINYVNRKGHQMLISYHAKQQVVGRGLLQRLPDTFGQVRTCFWSILHLIQSFFLLGKKKTFWPCVCISTLNDSLCFQTVQSEPVRQDSNGETQIGSERRCSHEPTTWQKSVRGSFFLCSDSLGLWWQS